MDPDPQRPTVSPDRTAPSVASELVHQLGGRYSLEMGIDVDGGDLEIERWFLASTLLGARIAARVAERTFAAFEAAGIHRIADVSPLDKNALVALLDSGGYTRYDFRTADLLQRLAQAVRDRYGGGVAEIGRRFQDPASLAAALDNLPGWGPITVGLFLRELRGVWNGARLPLDGRPGEAARRIGLVRREGDELEQIALVARQAGCDERDVEAALVRLALSHRSRAGRVGILKGR